MDLTGTIIFLDTETTSLRPDRRVWELGAVIRRLAAPEQRVHRDGEPPPGRPLMRRERVTVILCPALAAAVPLVFALAAGYRGQGLPCALFIAVSLFISYMTPARG